jgi:hypothetical protein
LRVAGFFALSMARTCSFSTVGQAVVGGAGGGIGIQGAREVPGKFDHGGLGIKHQLDLDLLAGHYAGGSSIGVA